MTPIEKLIAEIEALDANATAGPWTLEPEYIDEGETYLDLQGPDRAHVCECAMADEDKEFIARSRTLLPLFGKIIKSINRTLFYGDTLEDIGGEVCDIFDRYNDKLSEAVEVLGED